MKKEQEGIVIETKGKIAIVKVMRHGDCENCGSCSGDNAAMLDMNNELGAKKGEKIVFVPVQQGALKATFLVFWLPIISIFIGSQIGVVLAKQLNSGSNVLYQVVCGIAALVLSLAIIAFYEKKAKSDLRRLPRITKSLNTM